MAKRAVLPSADRKCFATSENWRFSKALAGRQKPLELSEPALDRAEFCSWVAI